MAGLVPATHEHKGAFERAKRGHSSQSLMACRPFIAVYMMSNRRHGALYIGITANLVERVAQHQAGEMPGFTRTYGLKRLVWFEAHELVTDAIQREKSLKKYKREWKINLLEQHNVEWRDLSLAWAVEHGELSDWQREAPPP